MDQERRKFLFGAVKRTTATLLAPSIILSGGCGGGAPHEPRSHGPNLNVNFDALDEIMDSPQAKQLYMKPSGELQEDSVFDLFFTSHKITSLGYTQRDLVNRVHNHIFGDTIKKHVRVAYVPQAQFDAIIGGEGYGGYIHNGRILIAEAHRAGIDAGVMDYAMLVHEIGHSREYTDSDGIESAISRNPPERWEFESAIVETMMSLGVYTTFPQLAERDATGKVTIPEHPAARFGRIENNPYLMNVADLIENTSKLIDPWANPKYTDYYLAGAAILLYLADGWKLHQIESEFKTKPLSELENKTMSLRGMHRQEVAEIVQAGYTRLVDDNLRPVVAGDIADYALASHSFFLTHYGFTNLSGKGKGQILVPDMELLSPDGQEIFIPEHQYK